MLRNLTRGFGSSRAEHAEISVQPTTSQTIETLTTNLIVQSWLSMYQDKSILPLTNPPPLTTQTKIQWHACPITRHSRIITIPINRHYFSSRIESQNFVRRTNMQRSARQALLAASSPMKSGTCSLRARIRVWKNYSAFEGSFGFLGVKRGIMFSLVRAAWWFSVRCFSEFLFVARKRRHSIVWRSSSLILVEIFESKAERSRSRSR